MLFIALIPIIICLWVALKKKLSFLGSVQLACLGFAIFVLIQLSAIYMATGKDVVTYSLDYFKQFLQENSSITLGYYSIVQMANGGAVNAQIPLNDAINIVYPLLEGSFVSSILSFLAAIIPLGGLFSFLIVRAIAKKVGAQVTRVPVFADFKLPAKFGRWSIIILAICWIGQMVGLHNFNLVFTIAIAFFGSIYYILGMAFMEWALKKQIKSAVGRGFIIALIALVGILFYIYTFIGLFEQLAKIRQRPNVNKVGL